MRRESPRFGGLRPALKALHPVDKALLVFMAVLMAQSMLTMFFPRETPALSGDIDVVVRTSAAAIFGYFHSANFVGRHSPKGQAALEEEGEGERVGSDFPRDGMGEGTPIGFSLPQAEAQQPGGIHAKAPFAGSPHKLASGADFTPEPEASGVQEHTPEQGAFAADEPAARGGLPSGSQEPSGQEDGCPSCLQINLATAIGLFCLVALLLLRNLVQLGVVGPEFDSVQATVIQFRDFVSGCVGFLIGTPTHQSSQTP